MCAGSRSRGPGARRGGGTRRVRPRHAGSSSGRSASPCPRGCRERRRVASSGVGCSSRSARMPTSVVVSAPSVERTAASGHTQSGQVVLTVVVEEHLLDAGSSATRSSSPSRDACARLDDDQPADGVELEAARPRRPRRAPPRAGGRSRGRSGSASPTATTASGYSRRAASIAPNASKSVFPCVAMTCSARMGPFCPCSRRALGHETARDPSYSCN